MSETFHNCIAGDFRQARSGATLDNQSSVTGEILCTIPRSDSTDVADAAEAAVAAQRGEWAQWSVAQRADLLDDVADLIEARLEELAALESRDTGKPFRLAATVDVPRAIANFRWCSRDGQCHQLLPPPSGGHSRLDYPVEPAPVFAHMEDGASLGNGEHYCSEAQ